MAHTPPILPTPDPLYFLIPPERYPHIYKAAPSWVRGLVHLAQRCLHWLAVALQCRDLSLPYWEILPGIKSEITCRCCSIELQPLPVTPFPGTLFSVFKINHPSKGCWAQNTYYYWAHSNWLWFISSHNCISQRETSIPNNGASLSWQQHMASDAKILCFGLPIFGEAIWMPTSTSLPKAMQYKELALKHIDSTSETLLLVQET